MALGTWRKPGDGPKTEKCNYPVLGALFWGEKPDAAKMRNFFTFYALADRTPTGEKSRNTGLLGHFGLGRPLALGEILSGKQKNTNSHIETEKRETNSLQLGPNTQS